MTIPTNATWDMWKESRTEPSSRRSHRQAPAMTSRRRAQIQRSPVIASSHDTAMINTIQAGDQFWKSFQSVARWMSSCSIM